MIWPKEITLVKTPNPGVCCAVGNVYLSRFHVLLLLLCVTFLLDHLPLRPQPTRRLWKSVLKRSGVRRSICETSFCSIVFGGHIINLHPFCPSDNDNNCKKLTQDESKPRADQRRKGRRKFTSSLQAGHMSHSSEQSQEWGAKKFAYLTQRFTPSSPRGDHSIQQRTKCYLITSQTDKNIALLI